MDVTALVTICLLLMIPGVLTLFSDDS